ncbi:hypothetical protein CRE_21743 [Caenorhabditis remanei]|uniref:Helicase ATP-binding domain-containing protein n=1 Tax=Caenorhabditis remanei TaxID=31234 RepID=E3MEK8_CAERE|nr:hypothetical protein CRE_21743 [Caenorhabditis remanei]
MSRVALNVDSYEGNDTPSVEIARFVVLYGKASTRKHKIWEGDGILVCYGDCAVLKSEDERDVICRSSAVKNLDQLDEDRTINIGSWSVQIQKRIPTTSSESMKTSSGIQNPPPSALRHLNTRDPMRIPETATMKRANNGMSEENLLAPRPPPKKRPSFVPPLIGSTTSSDGTTTISIEEKTPPFVLNEEDILQRKTTSAICVDSRFSRHLRDHQKDGIKFLFQRLKGETGGAILADDMGLGKSIQTMAATWALLRGSRPPASQIASSCLIVVPSSLVNNWKAEFDKWYRMMRFPAVIALTARDISTYQSTVKSMPYLIISYDLAQRHAEKLEMCRFDVLVCDEGHKLKNLDGRLRKTRSKSGFGT